MPFFPLLQIGHPLRVRRELVFVIGGVEVQGHADLPQVADVVDALGRTKGGQEQGREDGNDGDHHQQFDESEGALNIRFHASETSRSCATVFSDLRGLVSITRGR